MSKKSQTPLKSKKPAAFTAGIVLLVVGVTLILAWWPDVVAFVRGLAGMVLAVGGLMVLYFIRKF